MPKLSHAKPPNTWLRLFPQVALTCCGIAVLRFVETLVILPWHDGLVLLVVAFAAGRTYWLAGALLGAVVLVTRVVQRLMTGPPAAAKPRPVSRPLTREMQLRMWGFDIVAAWVVLSVLVLIVMSDTGTGPFAWIAIELCGLPDLAGIATFVLGLPAFSAPLVLLAVLPWHRRWPLLAGIQAAVKPAPQSRKRRHRP